MPTFFEKRESGEGYLFTYRKGPPTQGGPLFLGTSLYLLSLAVYFSAEFFMYRSHNPKIAVAGELRGKYELFWVAENAEHVVKREDDPSHQMSIKDVERFAARATYIVYGQRANYRLSYGLGLWQQKYYQVVCYLVEKPYKRCIIETCHVVNQYALLQICKKLFPKQ